MANQDPYDAAVVHLHEVAAIKRSLLDLALSLAQTDRTAAERLMIVLMRLANSTGRLLGVLRATKRSA